MPYLKMFYAHCHASTNSHYCEHMGIAQRDIKNLLQTLSLSNQKDALKTVYVFN